jgi:hypothetical protein
MSDPTTKEKIIEELTRDSLARGFIEYPKMLHKTDGGQRHRHEQARRRSGACIGRCTPDTD